jgi:hypothetical protein
VININPYRFALGGQTPSLDLQFVNQNLTNVTTGTNPVTFTRASSGTFVGSNGLLQTAATNAPRFDCNPLTGACLGLLVEEQRTNLLLRSEEFDNASWAKTFLNENVTANTTTAPNGLVVADRVATVAATAEFGVGQNVTVTANIPATISIFAKAAASNFVYLRYYGGAANLFYTIIVDLSTGVVTNTRTGLSTTAATHAVTALSNGWYRISCTATHNSTNHFLIAGPCLTGTQDIGASFGEVPTAGTGNESIYLWGAQIEVGACPTSYIPTTTAATTRSADVATITGTNFSSWYNQSEGTMFVIGSAKGNAATQVLFQADNTTTAERNALRKTSGSAFQSLIVDDGVTVVNVSMSTPPFAEGAIGRGAVAYATDSVTPSFNGALGSVDTAATMPTPTQAVIGNGVGSAYLNGHISRITYWPTRLPNAVLQQITT